MSISAEDTENNENINTGKENPYLTARREWNDLMGDLMESRRTWQITGIMSLLIALASVGGLIHMGSRSQYIPYIVEVDRIGHARAGGALVPSGPVSQHITGVAVSSFMERIRMVSPDPDVQRKAIESVYAHLNMADPAFSKAMEYLKDNAAGTPYERARKEMVSTDIVSVLRHTPDTWQVDWTETVRDRQGTVQEGPYGMRAMVTTYISDPLPDTTEEDLQENPLGIFVRDFTWSRLN